MFDGGVWTSWSCSGCGGRHLSSVCRHFITQVQVLRKSDTHRKFLQVSSLQGLVEMFGDLLPGGKPVVPLLLPGDMVVLPVGAGEGSPHLNHES